MKRRICLAILEEYNFYSIVDIGCGKGAFTHRLKKRNNTVVGIDISETALHIAKARFPDIQFHCLDVNNVSNFDNFMKDKNIITNEVELIFSMEAFSYVERWKELLTVISTHSKYFMISLFIPENPIGFVKDELGLVTEIEKHFEIIEWISSRKEKFVIIFGRNKK